MQLDVVQEEGQLNDTNLTRSTTANTRSSIVLLDNTTERAGSVMQVISHQNMFKFVLIISIELYICLRIELSKYHFIL